MAFQHSRVQLSLKTLCLNFNCKERIVIIASVTSFMTDVGL